MKTNRNIVLIIILVFITIIVGVLVTNSRSTSTNKLTGDDSTTTLEQQSEIIEISFSTPNSPKINAEIADENAERAEGLMDRKSMPMDQGMLFVFENEQPLAFWMSNTYIPLDIIFIDSSKKIIKIHHSAQPLNTTPRYQSDGNALYALEVNGGFAKEHGITEGTTVTF